MSDGRLDTVGEELSVDDLDKQKDTKYMPFFYIPLSSFYIYVCIWRNADLYMFCESSNLNTR